MIDHFINTLKDYSNEDSHIEAVLIVGSYARGTNKENSDIDVVIITSDKEEMIKNPIFIEKFGMIKNYQIEYYGACTSIRVWYMDGKEVEFGFVEPSWISTPLDSGTYRVLSDGFNIIIDKKEYFKKMLDDVSYIKSVNHIKGEWHQYDFILAASIYGWDYILDSANYMMHEDLENIGTICLTPSLGKPSIECVGQNIMDLPESSMLGVGGISKTLKYPVKIVWINQTNVIRIMTPINNEVLLTRYMETVIRRSFNTKDEMKLARKIG